MLIEVKDLKRGDEILIPGGSKLKYLKLLRDPQLSYIKDANGNKTVRMWGAIPRYKAVKCSTKVIERKYTRSWMNPPKEFVQREYSCSAEGHNYELYVPLNRGDIWLVKREKQ